MILFKMDIIGLLWPHLHHSSNRGTWWFDNGCQRKCLAGVILTVAVRTAGVDGGVVFPPALSNQLVEPVAEVLHLTGAEDTPYPHQVAMASRTPTTGVTTVPWPTLRDRNLWWDIVVSVRELFWGILEQRGSPDDLCALLGDLVVDGNREISCSR